MSARVANWYFDFVSPYAYFGLHALRELPADLRIRYRPVLFAGLLNHGGQKGPAEVPGKRGWTYRHCLWWARHRGIAFRTPAAHPFNPIPYLRAAIAADCGREAIETIYASLWTTGADAADPTHLAALLERLGLDEARLQEPAVKDALRRNTDEAIARGVFGVPSLVIDDTVFWGSDAMPMVNDYLAGNPLFDSAEMRAAETLPVGASRNS